eukprot:7047335-Pyramimonas_sp.AAC.1
MPGPQASSDLDPLWPSSKGSHAREIRRAPGDFPSKSFANRNAQRFSVKGRVRQRAPLHISEASKRSLPRVGRGPPVQFRGSFYLSDPACAWRFSIDRLLHTQSPEAFCQWASPAARILAHHS